MFCLSSGNFQCVKFGVSEGGLKSKLKKVELDSRTHLKGKWFTTLSNIMKGDYK